MGKYAESIRKEIDNANIIVCRKDDTFEAISLVKELMDLMRKDCLENHPNAINSIREMQGAVWQLGMLEDWVKEELENE